MSPMQLHGLILALSIIFCLQQIPLLRLVPTGNAEDADGIQLVVSRHLLCIMIHATTAHDSRGQGVHTIL